MSGFYQMHRGWQDAEFFGNAEYSERDAWAWLIEAACWQPKSVRIKGSKVALGRGQMTFAQRFLADKWGWSKSRVDRFLKRLAAENMILTCSKIGATAGHQAGQGQSVITICNYDKYQTPEVAALGNADTQIGATAGQQRGKEEEGKERKKEEKKEKRETRAERATRLPLDFTMPAEWTDWARKDRGWASKDVDEEAANFVDFWHAKAGRDGTKLDWQATWRNWCRNSKRSKGGGGGRFRHADEAPRIPLC